MHFTVECSLKAAYTMIDHIYEINSHNRCPSLFPIICSHREPISKRIYRDKEFFWMKVNLLSLFYSLSLSLTILLASMYISISFFTRLQFTVRHTWWSFRGDVVSYFPLAKLPFLDLSFSTPFCPVDSVAPSFSVFHSLFFGAALSHNRPDDSAVHQNGMACWAHVWVR